MHDLCCLLCVARCDCRAQPQHAESDAHASAQRVVALGVTGMQRRSGNGARRTLSPGSFSSEAATSDSSDASRGRRRKHRRHGHKAKKTKKETSGKREKKRKREKKKKKKKEREKPSKHKKPRRSTSPHADVPADRTPLHFMDSTGWIANAQVGALVGPQPPPLYTRVSPGALQCLLGHTSCMSPHQFKRLVEAEVYRVRRRRTGHDHAHAPPRYFDNRIRRLWRGRHAARVHNLALSRRRVQRIAAATQDSRLAAERKGTAGTSTPTQFQWSVAREGKATSVASAERGDPATSASSPTPQTFGVVWKPGSGAPVPFSAPDRTVEPAAGAAVGHDDGPSAGFLPVDPLVVFSSEEDSDDSEGLPSHRAAKHTPSAHGPGQKYFETIDQ
mgnify:CR=1 FL=1